MGRRSRLVLLALGVSASMGGAFHSHAQESSEPIDVVFRTVDGRLSAKSKEMGSNLTRKAEERGQIGLWITLNIPFNVEPTSMTPRERAAQRKAVRDGFRDILRPLLRLGIISHPDNGPNQRANGCKVVATSAGVEALVSDDRILHIIETANP